MEPHNTPDTPDEPVEAELYDRLLDAIMDVRDKYPRRIDDAPSDGIVQAVMPVFAEYLRAQVAHFDHLAEGSPQNTRAGRAMGLAYRAAAGHLRARADELAGGA